MYLLLKLLSVFKVYQKSVKIAMQGMFCNDKTKNGYSAHILEVEKKTQKKKRYQGIGHEGGLWKGHILAEQTLKTAFQQR